MEVSPFEYKIEELKLRLYDETLSYNQAINEHKKFKEVNRLYKISLATNKEIKKAVLKLEKSLNKEMQIFERHK